MIVDDFFITDIEQIYEKIDEAKRVVLYDTVAISSHKLAYFRTNGGLLLQPFFQDGDIVVITETVYKELIEGDHTGQFRIYLQQLTPTILVIREVDFICLLEQDYNLLHARGKLREACLEAFSTIEPLYKAIRDDQQRNGFDMRVLDQYETLFAGQGNSNKGEYSLLWLSHVLGKRIGQPLEILFVGMDQDLFRLFEQSYSTPAQRLALNGQARRVEIRSTETLIQGRYRQNRLIKKLSEDAECFRLDQGRKIWFREMQSGIWLHTRVYRALSNEEFVLGVANEQVDVIY